MIPDPSNPQVWNRYGYVQNNPINFNDPSGHELCDADGDCNGGKVINNRREKGAGVKLPRRERGNSSSSGIVSPLPEADACREYSCNIPQVSTNNGISLTFMQAGQPPHQTRSAFSQNMATIAFVAGFFMDIVETGLQLIPLTGPIIPLFASGVDVIVTFTGCWLAGECFWGRPNESLPKMLVVNQDVLVSTTEFDAPIAAAIGASFATGGEPAGAYIAYRGTDIITSGLDALYDVGRLSGNIPNVVSIGFSYNNTREQVDTYILLTQPK